MKIALKHFKTRSMKLEYDREKADMMITTEVTKIIVDLFGVETMEMLFEGRGVDIGIAKETAEAAAMNE